MTTNCPEMPRHYRFGPHLFDSARGLLWRDGTRVPLTPRTADVLRVLIEHRGDVVEKSDLLEFVWPNAVVEENNLARQVSTLRKMLQEQRGQHDIIATIPGHGYMFVAAVEALPAETGTVPESETGTVPESVLGTVPVSGARAPVSVRWVAAAAMLVCVAAGGLAVVLSAGTADRGSREDLNVRQLTFDGQLQHDPSWSPDGRALVYAADRSGNLDLYRRSTTDPTPIQLTRDSEDEAQPDWSPDGRWLAFRSEKDGGGIYVMPAAGGDARRLTDGGSFPRWSPDGAQLLVSDLTTRGMKGLRIVSVRDGEVRPVRPEVVSRFRTAYAAWHPDGRRVSIAGTRIDGGWAFVTVAMDAREPLVARLPAAFAAQVRDGHSRLGKFAWSHSGDQLYLEGVVEGTQTIWRATVNPSTMAWQSEPERLYSGPGEYIDLALSPDGQRLAFTVSHERTRVWNFPFDPGAGSLTGPGRPVTAGGPGEYDAAAPLDGSKVAYRTVRGNRYELWERSISGGEHLLSASSDWVPTSPRWSRDGTQLAYLRRLPGRRPEVTPAVAIHTASGERLLTLPAGTEVVPDDWSSDNAQLLAACRRGTQPMGTCLVAIGATGAADIRLVASDSVRSLICPRFSPDERWISFMAVDMRKRDVSTLYVMPASGGNWIPITDGSHYDDKPRWSPDGKAVYFLSLRDGAVNLWGQRFDPQAGRVVGEPFRVTSFHSAQQSVPRDLGKVEIAISSNSVFLPLTETSASIWMLDGLGR